MDERRRRLQFLLRPHDLRGADLRFSLLTILHRARRPCSIAELHDHLLELGLVVGGADPATTISDVLRHETHKGRVRRVRRGWYEEGRARPDTTTRRHRDRLRDLVAKAAEQPRDRQGG